MTKRMMLAGLAAFGAGPAAWSQSAPAWNGYAANPQHTSLTTVVPQALDRIHWHRVVDRAPDGPLGLSRQHYASPLVTAAGTVITAVKFGVADDYRIHADQAGTRGLLWHVASDYISPPHDWLPPFPMALGGQGTLFYAGKGGSVFFRMAPDRPIGLHGRIAFYGMDLFDAQTDALARTVMINTPITTDGRGNAWFGFIASGPNPAGLSSGIARISLNGPASWITAANAAQDPAVTHAAMGSAPTLSVDGSTVFVTMSNGASGILVGLDATTLAPKYRAALVDPATGNAAWISDESSASPTVGPDGDVFYGVLENPYPSHNDRGWLLHFSADLSHVGIPGSFGWDETVSTLPAASIPSYKGRSPYLLISKANNYRGIGTGDGQNRMTVLDPHVSAPDPIVPAVATMQVVESQLAPTAVPGVAGATYPWSVNAAAVSAGVGQAPASAFVLSEDGRLYRWNLASNRLDGAVVLAAAGPQAYTPSVIAPDGSVLAIAGGTVFGIGR